MARRLFLIETNLKALVTEIRARGAELYGVYNIVETFIEDVEKETLTQLLSVFEIEQYARETIYAKATFASRDKAWRLEKLGERERLSSESYYSLLLSSPTRAVEQKARVVFTLSGVRYSIESNAERNYSVVQVDYHGDERAPHSHLLKDFLSIDVLGELYMSLEETFARLHLEQKPAGDLEDMVSILGLRVNTQDEKAGI